MSRRTLRLIATVGPALVSLAIGVFAIIGVTRLAQARDAVARSRDITESLETLLARLTDAETAQRGYLITGQQRYLDPGVGAAADVHRALATARRLIADPTEQLRMDTLSTAIAEKLAELDKGVRAFQGPGGREAATALVQSDLGQDLMRRTRELVSRILADERDHLALREENESRLRIVTTALIFGAILLAALLSLLVNTMLERSLAARESADTRRQQALEQLEAANRELYEQASEMEAQTVELEQANEELQAVSEDLTRQTAHAERASQRVLEVLSTMSDAFIALDRNWMITQLNQEGVRLTTGNGVSLIGRSLWELWGKWIEPDLEGKLRAAMNGEAVEPFEYEVAPNRWFDFRMNATPSGLAIFFRDVSAEHRARVEREQLVEQVRAEHNRLITVVEQSPLAISIVEAPTGRRIIANKAAEQIFAIPLTASLADTARELKGFKPDGTPLSEQEWPLARAIAGGHAVINEPVEIERPDGERRRICINSSPVRGPQGQVDAAVAIFWDVTEQHHAEEELRAARREAEAASRAKSDFLAVMSHELRTPLSAIIGYEELLFDGITGPVTELQRTQLGRIKASATHLLSLIDEVLTLSRVDAGREVSRPERIAVLVALHDAAVLAEPLAVEKGLRLEVVRAPQSLEVWADPTKLRQILLNLLMNAIKFTDTGSVTLESRRLDDHVAIIVRDTGIGIAQGDLERIFDTFWQVEQRSTRKVGGTGLGLSVSRKLAHLMNGELSVSSTPGEGSEFTLRLPMPSNT